MRYIDADALIKKIYPMGIGDGKYTINAKAVKLAIDNAPTADVVPKSEVKRVYYNLQAVLEERAETKQEIAREIFEELARKSTYVFPTMLYTIAKRDVDELEKKYLEGVKNAEKNTDL